MCFGVFPKPFAADVAAQLRVQTRKKVHGRQREGAYVEAEGGDEKRTYFRIMKSPDASEGCEKLSDVLKNVFCSMAMKAVIGGGIGRGQPLREFRGRTGEDRHQLALRLTRVWLATSDRRRVVAPLGNK